MASHAGAVNRTARMLLHSRPFYCVEQHLKCPLGLGAVLDAKAKEHDLAFASRKADDSGFPLQALRAVGIAGEQNILGVIRVPGDDGAPGVGRWRRSLKGQGSIDKGCNLFGMPKPTGCSGST